MLTNIAYQERLFQKYTHLPWFTYPAIEYIAQLNLREKTIFEWGSGESTLFFSARCKQIISIEHDKTFYDKVEMWKAQRGNIEIRLCPKENFVEIIEEFKSKFDVIIVDSERRKECARKAIDFLNPQGLIIFDNSNWHGECCRILRNAGLIEVDFHGMGPHNNYAWTTSLFFTRDFNMQTLLDYQPHGPVFGDLIKEAEG